MRGRFKQGSALRCPFYAFGDLERF